MSSAAPIFVPPALPATPSAVISVGDVFRRPWMATRTVSLQDALLPTSNVLFLTHGLQMFGIYALRRPAEMVKHQPLGNGTERGFISQPVSKKSLSLDREKWIAIGAAFALPEVAPVGDFDLASEASFKRWPLPIRIAVSLPAMVVQSAQSECRAVDAGKPTATGHRTREDGSWVGHLAGGALNEGVPVLPPSLVMHRAPAAILYRLVAAFNGTGLWGSLCLHRKIRPFGVMRTAVSAARPLFDTSFYQNMRSQVAL